MKKVIKDPRGFSIVEAFLILIILGLIGFVVWYVYQNNKVDFTGDSNSSISENKQAENKLQEYDDELASFKYPEGWIVKRDDNKSLPGTQQIIVSSPEEIFPIELLDDERLKLNLVIFFDADVDKPSIDQNQRMSFESVELNNPDLPDANLIFTESTSVNNDVDNKPDSLSVILNKNAKAGVKYSHEFILNKKRIVFSTEFETSEGAFPVDTNFVSVKAMKATQAYEDLLTILNTLAIK